MQYIAERHDGVLLQRTYYELTLYMDLWNNEIVSHALSSKRGDRMTYINGLEGLIKNQKKKRNGRRYIPDQGAVYASKKYNDILRLHHIGHSMSRAGTRRTTSCDTEAINGWLKSELFTDFPRVTGKESIERR